VWQVGPDYYGAKRVPINPLFSLRERFVRAVALPVVGKQVRLRWLATCCPASTAHGRLWRQHATFAVARATAGREGGGVGRWLKAWVKWPRRLRRGKRYEDTYTFVSRWGNVGGNPNKRITQTALNWMGSFAIIWKLNRQHEKLKLKSY
jgi:hypothetical protein